MDVTNKEEIDQVLPWSTDVPSICKVPVKREANKKQPRKHNFHRVFRAT